MSVANTASKMLSGVQPRYLPLGYGIDVVSTISLTTSLALNDVWNMLTIGADSAEIINGGPGSGPVITGFMVDSAPLDTGSTITIDVGDSGSRARFMSASTVSQTTPTLGNVQGPNVAGTMGYQPFASTFATYTTASLQTYVVSGKCHAAAGVAAAGNFTLVLSYSYDP